MNKHIDFAEIARLPLTGDNVAIATTHLARGTRIRLDEGTIVLKSAILEGHRFAVTHIESSAPLLSWGMPFGLAIVDIQPGDYVCNRSTLDALRIRSTDVDLPAVPNFMDRIVPYAPGTEPVVPPTKIVANHSPQSFLGYERGRHRGVGTRNFILLLATSSQASTYVNSLALRLAPMADSYDNIDGIVAVPHSEGGLVYEKAPALAPGSPGRPDHAELILRTLAGFMVHPNCGAVLAVDTGWEEINNDRLRSFLNDHTYPISEVIHDFMSITTDFEGCLDSGERLVASWLAEVNEQSRTAVSLAKLKIALQCGGSDAFSGISGNPLAAAVAREIIAQGGSANLAETPELVGAEAYILEKVRDRPTAERFLSFIERFKSHALQHGISVEANTSGGNKFRGLYNITLKSLGAAVKRHPDMPLDYVIEYAEPMQEPGYYFMDSPGLDLESIAGQVAAGCSLIFFVTGNGSITNFPFVPTIKIVTTTGRYQMLPAEMDVNAGAYLDGQPMDSLAGETLSLSLAVASGLATAGEAAGHAQVQIWRNWTPAPVLQPSLEPDGQPLTLSSSMIQAAGISTEPLAGLKTADKLVGLILPTSLCAAEIARMAAGRVNELNLGNEGGPSRFISLGHTEGCASSSGRSGHLFSRLLINYACHPLVQSCLFLEHGCEVTHNDYFRHQFSQQGLDPEQYSWLSIQQDGGLAGVMARMSDWYYRLAESTPQVERLSHQTDSWRIGLHSAEPLPGPVAQSLGEVALTILRSGGTIVVPDSATLLHAPRFVETVLGHTPVHPTLAHGQKARAAGFHVMESQTNHWVETISGLGACGVNAILAYAQRRPVQGHPFIPLLVSTCADDGLGPQAADLVLERHPSDWPHQLVTAIKVLFHGKYEPAARYWLNTGFQVTRGALGISL